MFSKSNAKIETKSPDSAACTLQWRGKQNKRNGFSDSYDNGARDTALLQTLVNQFLSQSYSHPQTQHRLHILFFFSIYQNSTPQCQNILDISTSVLWTVITVTVIVSDYTFLYRQDRQRQRKWSLELWQHD